MAQAAHPRVLVVHNRYRTVGGEERSAELQLAAMESAGIPHALFERRSADAGRVAAAYALVRGGSDEGGVAGAVRDLGADVAHFHNMQPLIGPRGLAAARDAGAKVVLHLHNVRLFCATGFGERDGAPCERCTGRNTLPGLRLNCRGSVLEAAAYAAGLSLHQPRAFGAVDRFVTPGQAASELLVRRGLAARPRSGAAALPAGGCVRAGLASRRGRLRPGDLPAVAGEGDRHRDRGRQARGRAAADRGRGARSARGSSRSRRAPTWSSSAAWSAAEVRELLAGAAAVLMPSLLPRVLALLRARGDGAGRAGGGHRRWAGCPSCSARGGA